jgi:hypothetical protein
MSAIPINHKDTRAQRRGRAPRLVVVITVMEFFLRPETQTDALPDFATLHHEIAPSRKAFRRRYARVATRLPESTVERGEAGVVDIFNLELCLPIEKLEKAGDRYA